MLSGKPGDYLDVDSCLAGLIEALKCQENIFRDFRFFKPSKNSTFSIYKRLSKKTGCIEGNSSLSLPWLDWISHFKKICLNYKYLCMNNYSSRILTMMVAGILVLGIFSCTSSKKSSSSKKDTDTVTKDTAGIDSSGITEQDNLAPGTAKVLFLDFNLAQNDQERILWKTTVREVLAYGSSTPTIGIGDSMQLDVTGYFMNHDQKPGYYAERDSLICLISHRQGGEFNNNTSRASWELIDILNN